MNTAIGFYEGLSLSDANIFLQQTVPMPKVAEHDLLVEVQAVSVNPIDIKRRMSTIKSDHFTVQGYDACGLVTAVGESVKGFEVGDRVFYAGTTGRWGANQRFQLVDARITAKAPVEFSDGELAALPLTSITAWELLFEKFGFVPKENATTGSILIVNASGGVGSIATQLAKWAGLTVYGTSSSKNHSWLLHNGVDHLIDHHKPLRGQIEVKFQAIALFYDGSAYLPQCTDLIEPFGKIGMIVNSEKPLDLNPFKNICVDFYWEYMFAKTDAGINMSSQGKILASIAQLLADKTIHSTVTKTIGGGISTEHLKEATAIVENSHAGKVVVTGGFLDVHA
ncbi:zinc-binding alcohol dehydrogenase family protein [Enterococcus sp. DIV0876]|uniref:zinc-binding alcohol dehydrogenase family protein n=1 Tax=Enterococcus sp. DIV0876 TaxID=2774633 RepID=UPI003D2FB872